MNFNDDINNVNEISIKSIFKAFSFWPRIFALLWSTDRKIFLLVLILQITLGVLPILSVFTLQELIVSLEIMDSDRELLIIPIVLFLSVRGGLYLLEAVNAYYHGIFQKLLSNKTSLLILSKANTLELQDFENPNIQDKLHRSQQESGHRTYQILQNITVIIVELITIISTFVFLASWKWWVAFLVMLIPALSFFLTLGLAKEEFRVIWKRAHDHRLSWYLGLILTRDRSFKEIKVYNLGNYILNKFWTIISNFYFEDVRIARKRLIYSICFNFLNFLVFSFLFLYVLYSIIEKNILIGIGVGIIQALILKITSSQSLSSKLINLCEHNLYIEQLFNFLDLRINSDSKENKNKIQIKTLESIELKGVWFKYPKSNEYILKNINFKIEKGSNITIVGRNGSGKSTLIKIISLLYEIEKGEILINNIPIDEIDVEHFRKKIGILFQDFECYEMSLRENIGFGKLEFIENDNKIIKALDLASFHEDNLDKQLGKWFLNGTQLSGGQWQKIALARCFFREGDMYILDEPSSAMDPIVEKEIFGKYNELVRGKIGIFITHRLSTINYASNIIVIDKGKIIEEGTHKELLELKGEYAKLYKSQVSTIHLEESIRG